MKSDLFLESAEPSFREDLQSEAYTNNHRMTERSYFGESEILQNLRGRNVEKSIFSDAMTQFSRQMEKMQTNQDRSLMMYTEHMNNQIEQNV